MIGKSLAVALATSVGLALTPTPAEAGGKRSRVNVDLNFVVGGYAFPYYQHARYYGPGVVVDPFVHRDGRVRLRYLRHGHLFASHYIGYVDYGRHGRVRGFYSYDGGYYDNSGRYYHGRRGHHGRYGYYNGRRGGYYDNYGWYDRDGRYQRRRDRYDDRYDRRDRRRDDRDDRRNDRRYDRDDRRDDRDDRRNDRRDDRRYEPYQGGGVPPGGIQSQEFPGPSSSGGSLRSDDLEYQLDG